MTSILLSWLLFWAQIYPFPGRHHKPTGGGDTFAQAVTNFFDNGVNKQQEAIWYATNIAAGTTSVTATLAGAATFGISIVVIEVSGVATASPLDGTASHGDVGGPGFAPGLCGTITTTNANDIVVAGLASPPGIFSPSAGYTVPANGTAANNGVGQETGISQYKILSSTSTESPQFTWSGFFVYACGSAAFKKSGGGTLALVNSAVNNPSSAGATSISVTIPATTAGNALIVFVWMSPGTGNSPTISGVTDL